MTISSMTYLIIPIWEISGLHTTLQINPKRYFCTIKRSLFHNGNSTIRMFDEQRLQMIGLISRIAQEKTLKHSNSPRQRPQHKLFIGRKQGIYLFRISQEGIGDTQYSMVFRHTILYLKSKYICRRLCLHSSYYHTFIFEKSFFSKTMQR